MRFAREVTNTPENLGKHPAMEALGHLQIRVMLHIWRHGPATVHEVHDALNRQAGVRQLAYTTVLTVLRNLCKRRFLERTVEGRQHRFYRLIDLKSYQLDMVRQMREELFGGSVERMLGTIADDPGIDEVKRMKIRALVAGG